MNKHTLNFKYIYNTLIMECRICFDSANSEDMISPCLCRGSSKYVHRECLNLWFNLSDNPNAISNCSECKFNYYKMIPIMIPMNRIIVFIANFRFLALILHQLLILIIYYMLELFYTFEYKITTGIPYYFLYINNYFVSSCICLLLGIITNIILLYNVKDKDRYYKSYDKQMLYCGLSFLFIIIVSFYFIPIISMLYSTCLIIQLITNHYNARYNSQKKMIRDSRLIISFTDEEIEKLRHEIV